MSETESRGPLFGPGDDDRAPSSLRLPYQYLYELWPQRPTFGPDSIRSDAEAWLLFH